MDRDEALDLLPPSYATALRLCASGSGHPGIAERLNVPVEAVGMLLTIAEAKLDRLLERGTEGAWG